MAIFNSYVKLPEGRTNQKGDCPAKKNVITNKIQKAVAVGKRRVCSDHVKSRENSHSSW